MCLVLDVVLISAYCCVKAYPKHIKHRVFKKRSAVGSSSATTAWGNSKMPSNVEIDMDIHGRGSGVVSQGLVNGFSRARPSDHLSMLFEFQELSIKLPSGLNILQGVSGSIRPVCLYLLLMIESLPMQRAV